MATRLLIAFVSLDFFVNASPLLRSTWAAYAALGLGLAAAAAGSAALEAVAHLAWLALFVDALRRDLERSAGESARAAKEVSVAAAAPAAKAAAAAAPKDAVPPRLASELERALDLYRKNLDSERNAFGQPWTLVSEAKGVRVFSSEYPGKSSKWWRVECDAVGSKDVLLRELFDYDVRAPPKGWDASLLKGSVIRRWTETPLGREVDLCLYYTAPAAGGMVSSREFVDAGLFVEGEDGSFDYVNVTPSADAAKGLREIPSTVTGVRGTTHPGSGIRLVPVPGPSPARLYRYTMINSLDLGGWLSASLVNGATGQALLDAHVGMGQHLAQVAARG